MNPGIFLTALSAALYGSIGYFGMNLLESGLSVSDVLFWRFLLSALLLMPVLVFAIRKKELTRNNFKTLLTLFCLGGLFYGSSAALYFESSRSIGTGLAMVIFFAYPIFVVCFSVVFNQTRLTLITYASLMCIVVGCALIALGYGFHVNLRGITLALLSGLGYGTYVFWSKQASHTVSPAIATFGVCLGCATAYALFKYLTGSPFLAPPSAELWTHAGLFSLLGTVLPVLLLLAGMKTISASKASIISVLEPVTTLAVGAGILQETVTGTQFAGALTILCSAVIIQFDSDSK